MSDPERLHGRTLARNSVLNLFAQGLPLAVALVCMPVVVRRMDAERFGLLTLTWTVLNYFGLFDLGLGRAATRFVAEALARGARGRLPGIVGSALGVQFVSGVVGAGLLLLLSPWLVDRVLHVPPALAGEARAAFAWLALSLPFVLASGTFFGVLEAAQRFDRASAVRLPAGSATFLVPLAGVLLHWSLPAIVAAIVVTRILTWVALACVCRAEFPELGVAPRATRSELRRMAGFGGWITVSSVVAPLLFYMDRFFLGHLSGLTAVAHYAAPFEMVSRALVIPASLVGTLFPAFSAMQGRGEDPRVDSIVARACKFLLAVLGPLLVACAALAPELLRVWLGADYAADGARALQILAAGVLVNALAQVPYALLHAIGRPDVTARFHLLEVPLHAVVLWMCVRAWGVSGAALAWTLRATLDATLLFVAARRLAGVSLATFAAQRVPQAAAFVAVLALAVLAVGALATGPALWLGVGLVTVAGAGLAWRYTLQAGDRDLVLRALRPRGAA